MKRNRLLCMLGVGTLTASMLGAGGFALAQDKPAAAPPAAPAVEIKDERALKLLKGMSDTLARAKTMGFTVRGIVPISSPTGQYLSMFGSSRVLMQRPNKLFVESRGDLFPSDVTFDGKTVTAIGAGKKFYTQMAAAHPTIDAIAQSAGPGADVLAPFLDVLLSDPYAALTRDYQSALWVGQSTVGGVKTDHLAFTAKGVDWEVWIGVADKLPRLAVISHRSGERQPTFTVEYSQWKLDAPIPAQTFSAAIPKGATKIEFKLQDPVPGK
jgi:hypothetical protein